MRLLISLFALLALTACIPNAPDDGAVEKRMPISTEVIEPTVEVTEDTAGVEDPDDEERVIVVTNNNPSISDTQDFGAVSERVSIEDDKEILKAQRENFKVIAPTALPSRSGNSVNVAKFALETKHGVGEKQYTRLNPLGAALAKQNCRKFRLPDDAQEAFLKAGGPSRDPKNLDPDGDGFACAWSPDTYRSLLQ